MDELIETTAIGQRGSPHMTLRWERTFKALVVTDAVCAVGMLVCGFFSSRGNVMERLVIGLSLGMSGSTFTALGLILVYLVQLRLELRRRFRGRALLSDSEFITLSPALKAVDPAVVNLVRQVAAKEFRSIGGDRFHPDDDLETDLHLSDVMLWSDWLGTLSAEMGIDEDNFMRAPEPGPINTFGDLIVYFNRYSRRSKGAKISTEGASSNPVWDRVLDG
jgi:hypothetical protein